MEHTRGRTGRQQPRSLSLQTPTLAKTSPVLASTPKYFQTAWSSAHLQGDGEGQGVSTRMPRSVIVGDLGDEAQPLRDSYLQNGMLTGLSGFH